MNVATLSLLLTVHSHFWVSNASGGTSTTMSVFTATWHDNRSPSAASFLLM